MLCLAFYSFFRAKIIIDKGADFPTLPVLFVLLISILLLAKVLLSFAKDLGKLQRLVINVEVSGSSFNFYTKEFSIFKNGLFRLETKFNGNIGKHLKFTEKFDKNFGNVCEITENDNLCFLIVYKFMKSPEELSEILKFTPR